MNLSEFKAWFEGFTESMSGPPGEKAWKRIQEKIGKIEDAPPVTYHRFVDYYYQPWHRWFDRTIWSGNGVVGTTMAYSNKTVNEYSSTRTPDASTIGALSFNASIDASPDTCEAPFDSSLAFRDLGRAEASSLGGKKAK